MKHYAAVLVSTDDAAPDQIEVEINCRTCGQSRFRLHRAHLETLARVLPKVAHAVGVNLADGVTEELIAVGDSRADALAKADVMVDQLMARRRRGC